MGPLKGVKIVEVGGIGAAPFAGMMLSDMGADIVRVERKGHKSKLGSKFEFMLRGRRSIGVDLKRPEGVETVLRLASQGEALLEGFRPGAMEKMGLGPDICMKRNPRLVYGRMTGWGQEGPLSHAAGHDINFIALAGALHAIGEKGGKPVPPLNLLGDISGGGLLLAFGVVCALMESQKSGKGQVIDAAMVDGVAALLTPIYGMWAAGKWDDERGTNLLDGGAHFYDTYETLDGKWVSIGSIEPRFYDLLLKHAGVVNIADFEPKMDRAVWPRLKEQLVRVFKTKTRDEWCEIMEGTDVCFAPVLSLDEAVKHHHNMDRKTFIEIEGLTHPAPAPRFSRTRAEVQRPPPTPGEHTESVLSDWGFSRSEIRDLKTSGVI
jgi:alpha-methylacyl-CoA racemase